MDTIKDFLKKYNPVRALLALGAGFIGLVLALSLLGFALNSYNKEQTFTFSSSREAGEIAMMPGTAPSSGMGGGIAFVDYDDGAMMYANDMMYPPEPYPNWVAGNRAEEFEAVDYYGEFETSNIERVCGAIKGLKAYSQVVFLDSSEGEESCRYSFKVEKGSVAQVLSVLDSLNPRTLTEHTQTIEPTLNEFETREEILMRKLEAIEDTLTEASRAYDQLRVLATSAQDADALAKVISNKLALVERLTNERLSLRSQLEQLAENQALQIDRLEYVYFDVYGYERKVVDLRDFKDSWMNALQRFGLEFNQVLQGLTLGVIKFVAYLALFILYILIVVLLAKYGWRFVKRIWTT